MPPADRVDLLLSGAMVVTMDADRRVLDPGAVAIHGGEIVGVGPPTDPAPPAGETWDLRGRIVLPGFVNTHSHLVSALTRGLGNDRFQTGADPRGRAVSSAVREALDEDTCLAGARLALSELMMSGVTTTTDSQAARRGLEGGPDGTLRAMRESGMRAVFFRASVDRTEIVPSDRHDDPDLAVPELDRLHESWSSDLVTVGAEAMALHRVSQPLLHAVAGWSRHRRAPFAMHLAYSAESARYPLDAHGAPLLDLLAAWGILDGRFLGYHPVWLETSEIRELAASGAGVALCSGANMLIGAEAAPVEALLEAGVRLGLGTDQPNDGHDFFATMKATVLHARSSAGTTEFGSPELMLELATIGGARALHMEDRIGSIEPGKRADLVVLDGRRPALNPRVGAISDIVYAAGPSEVERVLVDGRPVVVGGRPAAWDLQDVSEAADRVVSAALRQAGIAGGPATPWPVERAATGRREQSGREV